MLTNEEQKEYMIQYIEEKWRNIIKNFDDNDQQFSTIPNQSTGNFPTGLVQPVTESLGIIEYLTPDQQTQFSSDFEFLDEDTQYDLVKDYPSLIRLIKNPSTELALIGC